MFENEYTMNRKLTQEYVFNVIGKKMMIIGLLIFVCGLTMYLVEKDNIGYIMLTCAFIGLFCAIASPIIMINNFENASKRLNNGKREKTHISFGNSIIMDEGKVHLEFEYSQIQKIMQTKNFIALKLGDQSAILVYKEGFTKGNKEEFMKFINSKIKE